MNCEQALELLSGHLDGQNTPEEELTLQAHLAECAACRALLEAFTAVDQGVAQLEAEPPEALLTGVMARIEADGAAVTPMKKRRFFFGPGTAVAAVAAVLLLVLGTGSLKNLQLGQASVAKPDTAAAEKQDAQPMEASVDAQSDSEVADLPATDPAAAPTDAPMAITAAPQPRVSAALVPEDGADVAVPQDAPQIRNAPGPAAFSVLPNDAQVAAELVIHDDAAQPALTTIVELQDLQPTKDEAKNALCTVVDVKTARAIVAAYEEQYTMELLGLSDDVQESAICAITIVQP